MASTVFTSVVASTSERRLLVLPQVARIRFHPDKVPANDLTAKVRAEEVSKILNSWDTSFLK
jgi:hypothetical protein